MSGVRCSRFDRKWAPKGDPAVWAFVPENRMLCCKAMCGVTCGGHCVPRVTTQWWSYAISVTARCRRSERRLTLLICHASTWSALEPHRSRDIWQARTEPIQANFNESRDYCIVIVPCLLIKAALKGNNRKPLTTLIPCKYAWLRSINTLVHCNSKE